MPKIRLIATILFWSAISIGATTLALVEGVQSKPDRRTGSAMEAKDRPHDVASEWKDDTGAPYRRRDEPFDGSTSSIPTRAIPTIWQDPPQR